MLRLAAARAGPADWIDATAAPRGLEFFVVSGCLEAGDARYGAGAWLRKPRGIDQRFTAKADTTLYVKRNHLGG
jgi:hypothetical protein